MAKRKTNSAKGAGKSDDNPPAPPVTPLTPSGDPCLTTGVFLSQCELLQAVPNSECTHFYQFVLLQPKQPPSKDPSPPVQTAKFPGKLAWKNAGFVQRIKDATARVVSNIHVQTPQPTNRGTGKAGLKTNSNALRVGKAESPALRQSMRQSLGSAKPYTPEPAIDLADALQPVLGALQNAAAIAAASQPTAIWSLALDYKQCWTSRGYVRGRLVRSLPLTPGEQLEVVIKSWTRQTRTTSDVESVEKNLSNELTGEEKWMLASKMTFSDQTNASINPSAGAHAGANVPIEAVKIDGGGSLGLSGNLSEAINHTTENGMEYTQTSMLKAAESLKSVRSSSVELVSETGTETTSKQVIANSNRSRTLTYHYFEVMENYQVDTTLSAVDLCLLLPLPLPEITADWLLCHECYLREMLPCDIYYAGFSAAKQLLAWQKADAMAPGGNWWATGEPGDSTSTVDLSGVNSAVENVLTHWGVVKNASLLVQPSSPEHTDLINQAVGDSLSRAEAGLQAMADGAASGDPAKVLQGVIQVAESPAPVIEAIGAGLHF